MIPAAVTAALGIVPALVLGTLIPIQVSSNVIIDIAEISICKIQLQPIALRKVL